MALIILLGHSMYAHAHTDLFSKQKFLLITQKEDVNFLTKLFRQNPGEGHLSSYVQTENNDPYIEQLNFDLNPSNQTIASTHYFENSTFHISLLNLLIPDFDLNYIDGLRAPPSA